MDVQVLNLKLAKYSRQPKGLFHMFQFSTCRELTGRTKAKLGTIVTYPVLTGRSNDQERYDQAVVHAQRSAMDRNSIYVLFLLHRRRKRRRNRLRRIHPVIQKRENSVPFTHNLMNYETTQPSF